MHGRPTFEKKMRSLRTKAARRPPTSNQQLQVGSWLFEENEEGSLVVRHVDGGEPIMIFPRP